ncbi:flagellar protein FlgN [Virgibacillus alimentarius]|uniref:Flagellar protein FlgN n=1 Tax=Virgibacillus alimentarius TaxID=698769 RepID=A0ABS4S720_9BACI|nr:MULTISPECIES: flagellar protein FlgN [Virgibacillus]MBP2256790.1 hypothetical protein [Virgibacillus alimentarius]HLR65659.1 flagellar protein FlgN [Virgibacillus sp.]
MSVKAIIQVIENLIRLHDALLENAKQKTEAVKEGSLDKLQMVLIEERKYIQLLEQSESDRKAAIDHWFLQNNYPLNNRPTLTELLNLLSNQKEKNELERKSHLLKDLILLLKQQEQLNHALIQQSMQFVQLSLNVLNPSINNMNYGNKSKKVSVKRTVFDSKA